MIQSTVTYSQIEDRLDSEYYKPEYLESSRLLWQRYPNRNILNLFKYVKGYAFESAYYCDNGVGVYRVTDIYSGIDFSNVKRVPDIFWDRFRKFRLQPKDLVITVTGNTVGLAFLMPDEIPRLLLNQNAMFLREKKNLSTEFLFAFMQTQYFQNLVFRVAHMGTRPFLGLEFFSSITLPPVSSEQEEKIKRLVNASYQKSLLSKKKYEEARQLVNEFLGIKEEDFTFEQSFSLPFSKIEGRLDCGYYQPLELLELPMFKKGIVPLEQLATINAGRTPAKHAYTQQGVRILKVRDLTNQGINWDEGDRAYTKEEVWEKTKRARVKENDLLLISAAHQAYYIGQEVDIVFDIPKEYSDKLLAVAELLVVRPHKINPYLLLWYLRAQVAYRLIQRLITGETSHLYAKDLVNLPIPKKLLDFQNVKKVEGLTRESLLLKKDSKNLLEQAKQEVEKIITQSS